MNSMSLIDQFMAECYSAVEVRMLQAESCCSVFTKILYPIEKIAQLSLDEYLHAPKGMGYDKTFCMWLRYELNGIAHMGNAFPHVFGVYMKSDGRVELSISLQNMFGDDVESAFLYVKKQIVDLLKSAEMNDYDSILKCDLNSLFKFKLLIVYFPDKFIPVCAKKTLEAYCDIVGLVLPHSVDMVSRNLALLEWKNTYYPFATWSNALFMHFCDWAWREKHKIDLQMLQRIEHVEAQKIESEINNMPIYGRDKEVLSRARINQSVFRKRLLSKYKKCCMCGVRCEEFLIASHIKPWSACEPNEKLDVNNGFLLCPNHDHLFDGGWISFDDNGLIMISKCMDEEDVRRMNISGNIRIELNVSNKIYLMYHRENVFRK